jgi:hypothetical protein
MMRLFFQSTPAQTLAAVIRRPSDLAIIDPATTSATTVVNATGTAPPMVKLTEDPSSPVDYLAIIPDATTKAWPNGEYTVKLVVASDPAVCMGCSRRGCTRGITSRSTSPP